MAGIAHNLHLRVIEEQSGTVYMELTYYQRGGTRTRAFYELRGFEDAPAVLEEVKAVLTKNARGMIWA
jgi:hypothetical protein